MRYYFELPEKIVRCSNCPCVSREEEDYRDTYYCGLTGDDVGYIEAQTEVMDTCPLQTDSEN